MFSNYILGVEPSIFKWSVSDKDETRKIRAPPKPRTVFRTVSGNTTVHDTDVGTEAQDLSLINNSSSDKDMDFSTSLPETSPKVRNIYF